MSLKVNDRLILRRVRENYGDTRVVEETPYVVLEASERGDYKQEVVLMKAGTE